MSRWYTIGCALLVALVLTSLAGAATGASTASLGPLAQVDDETPEPDAISMEIYLSGDERALWTIEHRYRLDDDTEREAFDELAADIEANETAYIERFTARMNGTVTTAATATDRDMAMDNVSIETEVRALPQEYGIIRYRFDWHGFADPAAGRIVAGDAIAGLFLEAETSLQLRWTEGYELETVRPSADQHDDRSVQWHGPTEFGTDEPRVELSDSRSGPAGLPALSTEMMAGGVIAVALLIGGGVLFARRNGTEELAEEEGDDSAIPSSPPPDPPAELLSNEEQVIQVLTERGGRMKQQEVVETLGWTDAKTSQVVSTLREAGQLESFRLGRENVLRLPEVDDEELP